MAKKKKKRGKRLAFSVSQESYLKWSKIGRRVGIVVLVLTTIMSLIAVLGVRNLNSQDTPYVASNNHDRMSFFATNFLSLWLMGDESNKDQLEQMYAGTIRNINTSPVQAERLNVADIAETTTGDMSPARQWEVTIAANVSSPGASNVTRMFYTVTLHQHGNSFKAEKLPTPTNDPGESFTVTPRYQGTVDTGGAAGNAVNNFIAAFYTQNESGSLGRFVASSFDHDPLNNSVYTGAEVLNMETSRMENLDSMGSGDTFDVMVTMKLSSTSSTFVTSQVYLTLEKTDNGQWLVADIIEGAPAGTVSTS